MPSPNPPQRRSHHLRAARAALSLVALSAACNASESFTTGQRARYSAMVYGTVSDRFGQSIGGVLVRSEIHSSGCADGSVIGESHASDVALGDGRYRQQVTIFGRAVPAQHCIRVLTRMDDGTFRVGAEVTGATFKPTSRASLPYDSIRADIVLP